MRNSKSLKRIISWIILAAFFSQDIVFAQSAVSDITLPNSLVTSKESHKANGRDAIINIRDAHSSLSAQESIVSILDSLVTNYDLKVVAIEGSSGYIDTSLLKTFPDHAARDKAAKGLMAKGLMSASEFFSITSDKNIALYGVEDRSIYKENLEEFRRIYEIGGSLKEDIDALTAQISALKERVYSAELRALEAASASGAGDNMSFKDNWQSITALAVKAGIEHKSYENLAKFVSSLELEKGINFEKADREREIAIAALTGKLSRRGLETAMLRSLDFKAGKISAGEYHLFLREMIRESGMEPKLYKDMAAYTDYIVLYESIDVISIFEEAKMFEDAVRQKLFTNDGQRALYRLSRYASSLKGLFEIKLANGDLEYLKEDMGVFKDAKAIEGFIRELGAKYKVKAARRYDLDKILESLPEALKFYRTAEKRNASILENTIARMRSEGRNSGACNGRISYERPHKALERKRRVISGPPA
jgi:hypothetical protein